MTICSLLPLTFMLPVLTLELGPFESRLLFEQVPIDHEFSLQAPESIAWQEGVGLYVLDQSAQTIFKWDTQGHFIGCIGGPGQGPGEFEFGQIRKGYVSIYGEQLIVLSGNNGRIQVFDLNGLYQETLPVRTNERVPLMLHRIAQDEFLSMDLQFSMADDKNFRILESKPLDGSLAETLAKVPDVGWKHENGVMYFHAFSPALVAGYDRLSSRLVYGDARNAKVTQIFLNNRNDIQEITVPLGETPVTDHDKLTYQSDPVFEDPAMQAVFPEKKPFFNLILPLSKGGLIVAYHSPRSGVIKGVLLQAKSKKAFSVDFGEQGKLLSDGGILFGIVLDDQDEFQIHQFRLN